MKAGWSIGLAFGLVAYGAAAAFTVNEVGFVGETDIGWALESPPTVWAGWSPGEDTELSRVGPFVASDTRPTEVLAVGGASIPLAINDYTGGLSDWPARFVRAVSGQRDAGIAMHVALGGLLLWLSHRFLRFHGTATAAGAVALLLGTDWVFIFFKKVLGGTEILLQTAGLLVIWALWSRRWKGGRHGTIALAVGVGLGLQAKASFGGSLLAFGVAALLTRWDRPHVKPPERVHWGVLFGSITLCLSPLILAHLHRLDYALLPAIALDVHPVSHDRVGLQWARLGSASALGRESFSNLGRFLGLPLGWLADAWGTDRREAFDPVRLATQLFVVWGTLLEWWRRTHSPSAALLRYLSLAVPLQLGVLTLLNRDLHHLAQATVPMALWAALALDRVASNFAPPRSWIRAGVLGLLCLPAMVSGIRALRNTDPLVRTARSHTFSRDGQAALREVLAQAGVERVVTSTYELYGLVEQLRPTAHVEHVWAAVSRGDRNVDALRRLVGCDHYLWARGSAPFVYDWHAPGIGKEVASLHDSRGVWAVLSLGDCEAGARVPAQP